MKPFKAGLVGCGNIGGRYDEKDDFTNIYTHAGMYRETEGLELVCAADRDMERLQQFGEFWKINRLYGDPVEMFRKEKLDIVSIATPDSEHDRNIMDALEFNPPRLIFSEKPLASDVNSAMQVLSLCKKKDVTLVVDYIRRWDTNHQKVKEYLREGKLGAIQSIVGYYVRGIRHNGCQMINLLQFFFGPIKELCATGSSKEGSFTGDPSMNLILTTEDGHEVHMIGLDRQGYGFSIFELDIFGKDGRIRLTDGGQKISLYEVEKSKEFKNFKQLIHRESCWSTSTYGSAMRMAGKELVSFLSGHTSTLQSTADDAVRDLIIIEAALASAGAENKLIKV